MDWLAGWLKTVIMVIMLATFVDLLLPSNTMQRYVKTVLSLFHSADAAISGASVVSEGLGYGSIDQSSGETSRTRKPCLREGFGNPFNEIARSDYEGCSKASRSRTEAITANGSNTVSRLDERGLTKTNGTDHQDVQVLAQIDNNGKPSITKVRVTLDDIEAKKQPSNDKLQKHSCYGACQTN